MATVRMSDKLLDQAIDEAKRQFDNVNKTKEISLDIGDLVYTNYVQPVLEAAKLLRATHPHVKNFMRFEDQTTLSVGYIVPNTDVNDKRDVNYTSDMELNMSAAREVPGSGARHYNTTVFYIPFDCEEAVQIREITNFNEDRSIKRREYADKVKDTLHNFTTVNQALKAWPALEKLITDPWVLQRVNEKVQRKKKQAEQRAEIELNETDLNSVILTNALIGDD